jgi:hypothetical protein
MNKLYALFIFFFTSSLFPQTLIETVVLPSGSYWNSSYGLVYENSKYWISSGSSTSGQGFFYAVDDNGNIVDTVTITGYPGFQESQGLAFDGLEFWYIDRKTARCDLFRISSSGLVLDSIPSAELFGATNFIIGGAAWDGSGLWISVYSPDLSAALYKINVASRQIVDTINVIGLQPQGITIKGDTLYYVNDGFSSNGSQGVDRIYAVDLNTEDTLYSFSLPHLTSLQNSPRV